MARNWTPAQRAAMKAHGRTLLISAAAGSGKTATLTERIIRRLTDSQNPADLSRLLIVTFTRAAAAELRERIAGALTDAISRDPGNRHLQKQLISLGSAHISTIDAFVREPVKAHFAEVGLPAANRIADEAELRPLRERIMGDVIDELYVKYASDARPGEAFSLLEHNPFADLCDSLTPSKNDEALIPTLLDLYERLLAFPAELNRLLTEAEHLETQANGDFFASDHGRVISAWIADFQTSSQRILEHACDVIASDEAAGKAYEKAFRADLQFVSCLAEATTYQSAYHLFSTYQNERLGSLRNASPEFAALKDARTGIVDAIKDLRKTYFVDSPEDISKQMTDMALMCRILYDCLSEYDRRILSEKQARGICDFTDNRRYLLRLLRGDDGQPSPMARDFRAQFDEVYIDEYQDVDELQDEIFRLVGGNHRFMVGDIKQSIYGFRGADPGVFARYRRNLSPIDLKHPDDPADASTINGNSIFMSDNFRCDESVIRVTNAICGHLFRACPASMNYQAADDLGFAKPSPSNTYVAPRVEVSVLTKPPKSADEATADPHYDREGDEMSGVEVEATYVANRIAALLRAKTPLADGRPITPGDIVILMRNRTGLSAYMKALTAMGIPTGSEELDAIEAGRDILHGSDMMYLVNLLRVIDNPDNDIPLSEVLRAPFPGFDLEDVLSVRRVHDRAAQAHSLYAALEDYASTDEADPQICEKASAFIAWIEHYRTLCATQPADGLLRLLRQDEKCACRHTEAFLYLYESARTCRTATFVSLYTFLRYFEKKLETTQNAATATKEATGGHVSIMTIHKSKGLEFPVCFVVRCGQYFSSASLARDLIFHPQTGVSMKLYRRREIDGMPTQAKIDTTLRAASALATKLTEREEEMRVLYVAMTRARERLCLVGMGNEKPFSFAEGDRFATLSCNGYMRWILGGLSAHPEVSPYYDLRYISTDEITPDPKLPILNHEVDDPSLKANMDRYRTILEHHAEPSPLEKLVRRVPTKVPASRMSPHMLDTCVFYDTDMTPPDESKLPDNTAGDTWCDAQSTEAIRASLRLMASGDKDEFELLLRENRRPTAAEKGTAAHLFLQFCDYGLVCKDGLENEITRLGQQGYLSERTARILDRQALTAFFNSRFFARMRNATHTERELKFSRFIPLSTLTAHPEFAEALGDRTLYVQGSIDLLCEFPDGSIELCDYKADRITPEEKTHPDRLAQRMQKEHGAQLSQYATAIEELYGRKPSKVYIYSLPLGEAVEIHMD